MSPDWQKVKEIFQAAVDRPPEERAAFLAGACGEDEALRREVESLIASDARESSFIDRPAYQAAANILADAYYLKAGQIIGHYRILSTLGHGGMGEVYVAQDSRLARKVALKILPAEVAGDRARLNRFVQEAKAASALNHPNIITIYETDQTESGHFIAAEFVEGETLRERLRGTPIKLGEALQVAIQAASALSAAHAAGIIHRDIKPENVMIRRDGIAKVLDFGLAKLSEPPAVAGGLSVDTEAPTRGVIKTDTGIVMGTAVYMSPEQARGLAVDARTDIFSVGVLIYEMVAGRLPFEGSNTNEILASILSDKEPPPLGRYAGEVPTELERIVTKALRKDREERYQNVKDMLLDLKNLKQRLEFESELQRSAAPELTRRTAVQSGPPIGTGGEPISRLTSIAAGLTNAIRLRRGTVIIAAAILIAVAAAYFYFARGTSTTIDSIAILPFVNEGGDPNTEYLSDGITDSLIDSLSQLPNLKVKSHSSVFRHKTREVDPQVVGRELNVQAVLTGRVATRGDNLTISLELVDVRDNNHLWGEQYSRKLSEIFAIQEEISKEVTNKLRLRLTGEQRELLTKRYTDNTEAYQLYLKGRFYWNKRTEEGLKKSLPYFDQAIENDPNYALAYAGLADSYNILGTYSFLQPKEAFPKAKAAAVKALAINDLLTEPHTSVAWVYFVFEWDYSGAEREFKRAIELDPNYPTAHSWYSMYLASMGRTSEARAEAKRAQELDPTSLIINTLAGWISILSRDYKDALERALKTVELDPNFSRAYWVLGLAYEQKGMYDDAVAAFQKGFALSGDYEFLAWLGHAYASSGKRREAENVIAQLTELAQHRYVSSYDIAEIYAGLGDKDRAFAQLEKAYEEHPRLLVDLRVEPKVDPLRSDPRFADLLRRVHLGS